MECFQHRGAGPPVLPAPDPAREGIIYLLENEAFEIPVIKIGRTGRTGDDLAHRIRTLNIGVPLPFTCFHAARVQDAVMTERLLHDVFHHAKKHWRGEFYEVEPWRVLLVLRKYEIEDMTAHAPGLDREDENAVREAEQNRERRDRFTFAAAGIPVGETLTLVGSDIQCEVADERTGVLYQDQCPKYALSTLTTQLKGSGPRQGIRYWEYQGETLLQRWIRILEQGEDN